MATLTERDTLNKLIETCRDAELGFRNAAELVEDDGIKSLFLKIASHRARFATELAPHGQRLGGPEAGEGTTTGTWHRRWMQFRNRVTSIGDAAVVAEADRGDAVSLNVYSEAVNGILPPETRDLVEEQFKIIVDEHGELAALRESLVIT
jgi:uncharacterized protein (TIGR02284 family)